MKDSEVYIIKRTAVESYLLLCKVVHSRISPVALKTVMLLLVLSLLAGKADAIDIFAWLSMAEKPLAIADPDWVRPGSRLRLEFDNHEYYKRWVDDRLVNDFSGHRAGAELSVQLLSGFTVGARKKLLEPQNWENSQDDKSARFKMTSESESGDVFCRFRQRFFTFEAGVGSSKSYFEGSYDLHPDLINALGENPPLFLNNGDTHRYARLFSHYRQFKLTLGAGRAKYSHRLAANTPAMNVVLNHARDVSEQSAELAWEGFKGFSPYLRYTAYKDEGSGENYKDVKFKFGNNSSNVEISALSLGGAYRYKGSKYFAELSQLDLNVDLQTDFNLITLNPLFLFATNRVDYHVDFRPDDPWALRLGFQRFYRGIEYFAQYSYTALSGPVNTVSSKEYNMFSSSSSEVTIVESSLELHRLGLCLRRPDKEGQWQAQLNLLVPIYRSDEEEKPSTGTVPGATLPTTEPLKPEESVRGGWQIIIAREFKL